MSVKRLSPRIVEDTDPPFAPVAVMRYDNDGLYVPVSEYAALLARHNALKEAVAWIYRKNYALSKREIIERVNALAALVGEG